LIFPNVLKDSIDFGDMNGSTAYQSIPVIPTKRGR